MMNNQLVHLQHVYCTRPITLENPSTALDVRLTQSVRSTSSVRVFFRATSLKKLEILMT